MDRSEISSRVLRVIREKNQSVSGDISEESNFADLGMDSLDMAMMAMTIEREFKVDISSDELLGVRVVQDVIDGLERKLQ